MHAAPVLLRSRSLGLLGWNWYQQVEGFRALVFFWGGLASPDTSYRLSRLCVCVLAITAGILSWRGEAAGPHILLPALALHCQTQHVVTTFFTHRPNHLPVQVFTPESIKALADH